jgi:formate hydrogenlyase subunit 3/multisubunit Na+/H+ antiporter MnhD subunit
LQSVALGAGFYGLWRFGFEVLRPLPTWCGDALLILGGVTAILGIVYALTQDDQRRFLGYSTVEHTGIAMVGLAVALLGESAHQPKLAAVGLLAATLEVCAHNLAKTLALISIDRVQVATGERRIDPLGGLARRVPLSSAGLGAACVTLAAIPPLGGFVSEWFTFEALLQGFRMPTLLSRLLCALAAAALALTAGVGLLAFAKYLGFICLGPARERRGRVGEPGRWPVGLVVLGVVVVALGALAPWEIQALGDGLRGALGFDAGRASVTHPLVLGPVFADFSVLAPTWLAIVLPSYALIAIGVARGLGRGAVRRAPVWVAGSGAELASVQYRPSAFSNPMRVILRGPLGYRARVADQGEPPVDVLQTRVVLAVDRFFYAPLSRLALALASIVRRFQSGRLSMYLLYMLIAVLAALSLIPILR